MPTSLYLSISYLSLNFVLVFSPALGYAVGGEPFLAFCRMGSGMVQRALAKVGWTARAEDSHTDKLLRATIIGLLTGESTSQHNTG